MRQIELQECMKNLTKATLMSKRGLEPPAIANEVKEDSQNLKGFQTKICGTGCAPYGRQVIENLPEFQYVACG